MLLCLLFKHVLVEKKDCYNDCVYSNCKQLKRFVLAKRVQLFLALAKLSLRFIIVTRKAS